MWWMPNQAQDSRKAVGALAARVCSCLLQLSSCLYSYLRALRERDIKSRDPDRTRGPEINMMRRGQPRQGAERLVRRLHLALLFAGCVLFNTC